VFLQNMSCGFIDEVIYEWGKNIKNMKSAIGELVLVMTASYKGDIGFGTVFDCEIKKVLVGSLNAHRICLIVLPNDKDSLNFIMTHLHPEEIQIEFIVYQQGESYGTAVISGFVDESKTSWKISHVSEANGVAGKQSGVDHD